MREKKIHPPLSRFVWIFWDQVKLRLVFQDLWLDPNDPCWRRSSSTSDVMHGRSNLQPPVLMEVGCVCVFLEFSWSQSSLPPLLSSVLPLSHQGENYHGPIDLWGIPLWPQAAGVQCCDTGSPGSGGRVHPAHTCLSTAALYIKKKMYSMFSGVNYSAAELRRTLRFLLWIFFSKINSPNFSVCWKISGSALNPSWQLVGF